MKHQTLNFWCFHCTTIHTYSDIHTLSLTHTHRRCDCFFCFSVRNRLREIVGASTNWRYWTICVKAPRKQHICAVWFLYIDKHRDMDIVLFTPTFIWLLQLLFTLKTCDMFVVVSSITAHPNSFTLDTAPPRVLSNTLAKCEVDRVNGCRDNRRTDRQRLLGFVVRWCSTILLFYPVVHKVSEIGSTLTNYKIKILLHVFISDKNWIISYSIIIYNYFKYVLLIISVCALNSGQQQYKSIV